MLPISSYAAHLQWVQPAATRRYFELRLGEQLYGSLEFASSFGSRAVAAAAGARWTFKRTGFFNVRVTVRVEGQPDDLAVYYPRWTGREGHLKTAGGRMYEWRAANFWATRFVFSGERGDEMVIFKQGLEDAGLKGIFKYQARVEIAPAAADLPDLPLLALLGWYLMILSYEDSAATAAAAASSD